MLPDITHENTLPFYVERPDLGGLPGRAGAVHQTIAQPINNELTNRDAEDGTEVTKRIKRN